jgi:hypothetical protein
MAPRSSRCRRTKARTAPTLLLLLAACANQEAVGATYDLRWVGSLTPEAGRCEASDQATMTMLTRDRSITFAPTNGVLVLRGAMAADGAVHAAFDAAGEGHKKFPLRFTGTLSKESVSGTYSTPICRARVILHPAKPIPSMFFEPGNLLGLPNP